MNARNRGSQEFLLLRIKLDSFHTDVEIETFMINFGNRKINFKLFKKTEVHEDVKYKVIKYRS